MEPLFKVGEKVRIKKRTGKEDDYKYSFTNTMSRLAGEIFTIKEVEADYDVEVKVIPDDDALYTLLEDNNKMGWASSMLEKVSDSNLLLKKRNKVHLNFNI